MKTHQMKYVSLLFLVLLISCTSQESRENESNLSLWYEHPADEWVKAIPVGNGRLGAMIYGGTDTETVALNEITMWSGQYDENQEDSCGKKQLEEIRRLFFEGKIAEGNALATQHLSGKPHSFGTHLPIGDLKMTFGHDFSEVINYKRELDIRNSITTVSYAIDQIQYKREYICSNPDDVFLIKLTADSKAAISFDLSLDLLRESVITTSDHAIEFSGQALFPKQGPGGVRFLGKVKVLVSGGGIKQEGQQLKIDKADEVVIVLDIRTDYKNPDFADRCNRTIAQAETKGYDKAREDHMQDYHRLFDRVAFSLGQSNADQLPTDIRWQQLKQGADDPGLFSLFFQYGRYLLISSSRENSPLPANLQGIWNDNLACNMGWTCDYHLDINTEQNYWLANIGNLHECNAPLFNYIEDLSVHGEKTARKVYGSPGWTAHTVANVWGYTAPGQSVSWGLFPTGGAWIGTHLWSHFCYTRDIDFLRNKAYPILKKGAIFFLDYMVKHPENGYLMTGPSISPENSFKINGQEFSLSMMPTCDRILVYENFTSCIEASRILGVDDEFRQSLETAIAQLPPLKIGKDGTIQEWLEDYDLAHPNHRHSSHLLALYPYNQISLKHTPELAEAAGKSVYRQLNSENWEDVEWSRANMICFYARLKNAEEAYKNMKGLLAEFSRENLFTIAPKGIAGAESDIFEFDANEAGPAAMAEMLVQAHEGYIEFLPALPEQWNTGFFRGLCVVGGAEVDLEWENGQVRHAVVKATCDNHFRIKLPETDKVVKVLKNNQEQSPETDKENIVSFQLKRNDRIELQYK